jgi:hypothetical protein
MIWLRRRGAVLFFVLMGMALGLSACQSDSTNPYLQIGPTPTATTDTFTGTLVNSSTVPILRLTHTFATTVAGSLSIILTDVQPDATIELGFGIGSWDAATSTCGPLLAWNNTGLPGISITGNAVIGSFCVQVYDVGKIPAETTTNYTLTVTHY